MIKRTMRAAARDYETRYETYQGREHLVVPVVALVEGVVHAMNAADAELVTADEFSRAPWGWNGRPVYVGHPLQGGQPVSGNSPELLESRCIGTVFNTRIKSKKLMMEAWIDVEKAKEVEPELLKRIEKKDPIEISVGVFVETEEKQGEHNGKKFNGAWKGIVPDHLALLPSDSIGACSREMGCGVRAAQKEESMDPELEALRDIPTEEREEADESDFAGPNRSFPILKPEDVGAAASSLGRAKGDRDAIRRKIVSIAYRKGDEFVAELPEAWKKKKDQKNASMISRLMRFFRVAQDTDEMTDQDLRRRLYEALKEKEPHLMNVDAWFPVDDPSHVVYTCFHPEEGNEYGYGDYVMYERAFDLSNSGVVTLNGSRVEVQPVMRYEPVEGAGPETLEHKTAVAGAPCRCQHEKTPEILEKEKRDMEKAQLVKFLETATDEQVKAMSAVAEGKPAAQPAAQPTVAEQKVVETPKTPTFDEVLATAAPETRAMINEGIRVAKAKKDATIKSLSESGRCGFTKEQLEAMPQADLDNLVRLADIKVGVDFSGQGLPKETNEKKEEVPAAPDLVAALSAKK